MDCPQIFSKSLKEEMKTMITEFDMRNAPENVKIHERKQNKQSSMYFSKGKLLELTRPFLRPTKRPSRPVGPPMTFIYLINDSIIHSLKTSS